MYANVTENNPGEFVNPWRKPGRQRAVNSRCLRALTPQRIYRMIYCVGVRLLLVSNDMKRACGRPGEDFGTDRAFGTSIKLASEPLLTRDAMRLESVRDREPRDGNAILRCQRMGADLQARRGITRLLSAIEATETTRPDSLRDSIQPSKKCPCLHQGSAFPGKSIPEKLSYLH